MARRPQTTSEDRAPSKRVGALAALWPFVRPYRATAALALVALTLTASISLILPLAVRRIVDGFQQGAALLDHHDSEEKPT